MADSPLLTPFDAYNREYKNMHKENVSMFFEGLVDKAGVDRDANKKTIIDIAGKRKEIEELEKKKRGNGFLKFLLIFGLVAFSIATIVLWYFGIVKKIHIIIPIVASMLLVAIYVLFIHLIKKVTGKMRDIATKLAKLKAELDDLIKLSWEQMAKLNKMYDWSMAASLAHKTVKLLELDDNFNPLRYEMLCKQYGLLDNKDSARSTSFVQSGSILGNPFLFSTFIIQDWGRKTYHGQLVISWVERYRDSNGNMRTRTRTQTLHASVTKPIPTYRKETKLIMGNEAAPNLSFSRLKSGSLGKSEKQITNMINKEEKQLDKMAKKAVMNQTEFTRIGNLEFESLFGGEDRDNEMEFRLLFTPLAQQNFVKLLRSQEPYGDDFVFYKRKKINVIKSDHSQRFSYLCNPAMFITNSYEDAKIKFEGYCNEYFQSMYFDFIPLLSIPLYQQYKSRDYIYQHSVPSNVTTYEHEVMANAFDQKALLHPESKTQGIMKTSFNTRNLKADNVTITAHSYKTIDRVEYVSTLGGDGKTHQVPVHWDEYIPIQKQTQMEVKEERTNRSDFIDHVNDSDFTSFLNSASLRGLFNYQRGLLAVLLKDEVSDNTLNNFSNCLTSFERPLDESLSDFDDSDLKNKMFKDDVLNQTIDIVKDIDKSNK
ncbi:MAG: QueT transporter family protein [Bacilli bacterium]|nr:QueT transporter family protein [Bacilli bacterium]